MPRKKKTETEATGDGLQQRSAVGNVSADLIAEALETMLDFDSQMASVAGRKGAAIARYCEQGIDRELLAALNKIGRKDQAGARMYIEGLTRYAVAAEVVGPGAVTGLERLGVFEGPFAVEALDAGIDLQGAEVRL